MLWAHPYDSGSLTTGMDGDELNKQENDKDDDEGKDDVLRRQNALSKEKLEAMKLKWNENKTRSQLQEEKSQLHDHQITLPGELAAKAKQIENLEKLSQHQTALQRTVDEITDRYWSVLDEVDGRRTRLDDDSDLDCDSRDQDEERTVQGFGRRLESWLKDYETLISKRNDQCLNNGDVNSHRDVTNLQLPLEHTQLTADAEQLEVELKAKDEELRRKNEEIDQIRIENETLQMAASSSSPLVASDREEQLVMEIERLTFDPVSYTHLTLPTIYSV